jgi:hypothetical protein
LAGFEVITYGRVLGDYRGAGIRDWMSMMFETTSEFAGIYAAIKT